MINWAQRSLTYYADVIPSTFDDEVDLTKHLFPFPFQLQNCTPSLSFSKNDKERSETTGMEIAAGRLTCFIL